MKSAYIRVSIWVTLWLILSFSFIATWLESDIRLHMLVQIPALVLIGYQLSFSDYIQNKFAKVVDPSGQASVILAVLSVLFWMIPKSLDQALNNELWEIIKYLTLPLLIGLPLGIGWHKVSIIFQGVVIIEFLAMLLRLGWLYSDSPIRLCSSYGLEQQQSLGALLLLIALTLSMYWVLRCFFPTVTLRKLALRFLNKSR